MQLFKYGLVGLVALFFDYSTLILLTEQFNTHYLISATAGFLVGLTINYVLATHFVFTKSKLKNKKTEFTIFAIIGVGGLVFNNMVMWGLTDYLFLDYRISKLIAVGLVFLWNFYARKYILFK